MHIKSLLNLFLIRYVIWTLALPVQLDQRNFITCKKKHQVNKHRKTKKQRNKETKKQNKELKTGESDKNKQRHNKETQSNKERNPIKGNEIVTIVK